MAVMVVREYRLGNAEIRVYRPVLTDLEREMREGRIRSALRQVGRSIVEKRERDTNGNSSTTRDFNEE